MRHTFKQSALAAIAVLAGVVATAQAHSFYPGNAVYKFVDCAFCHGDGRVWTSTPVSTTPPLPPPTYFNGVAGTGNIGNGTAVDMAAFFAENGFVVVAKRPDGTFTGSLRMEGRSLPFRGTFSPTGNETVSVAGNATASVKAGAWTAQLAFSFNPAVAPGVITGTVTAGGSPLAFTALPGYTGTKPVKHPRSGHRYTIVLPSPDSSLGHGYATLTVGATGSGKLVGKLADGTPFASSTLMGNATMADQADLNWIVPVAVPLYQKNAGLLFGEIQVPQTDQVAAADVVGSLGWLRPANGRAKLFPDGFLKELEPVGTSYKLPKGSNFLTGLQSGTGFTLNAAVRVLAGQWTVRNIPSLAKPSTISLVPASGIIKGKVVTVLDNKKVATPFEGVVFSKPLTLPGGDKPVWGGGFSPNVSGSDPTELTVP